MRLSLLVFFFRSGAMLSDADRDKVRGLLRGVPGLTRAHLYTPAARADYYFDDGEPPALALQLYFAELAALEGAVGPEGALQPLRDAASLPSIGGARVVHQAMVTRDFPVLDPVFRNPPGTPHCSFLVHYPGQAEDLNAWLSYYLANHTKAMLSLPGLREIEVLTRIDWIDAMPGWERANHMQRNKVVFDSPEAMSAALTSEGIKVMRADYAKFPPFTGDNIHYPLLTEVLRF